MPTRPHVQPFPRIALGLTRHVYPVTDVLKGRCIFNKRFTRVQCLSSKVRHHFHASVRAAFVCGCRFVQQLQKSCSDDVKKEVSRAFHRIEFLQHSGTEISRSFSDFISCTKGPLRIECKFRIWRRILEGRDTEQHPTNQRGGEIVHKVRFWVAVRTPTRLAMCTFDSAAPCVLCTVLSQHSRRSCIECERS